MANDRQADTERASLPFDVPERQHFAFTPQLASHPLVALGPSTEGQAWSTEKTLVGLQVILQRALQGGERVTVELLDQLIAALDGQISEQMDEILHDPAFQAIESSWRGLKLLIDRTNFTATNKNEVFLLDASKEELENDFEAPARTDKLYNVVFEGAYGVYGGEAFGAIIGNYTFGPGTRDIAMLRRLADIAEQSHAPFIAAAGPQFWEKESFTDVAALNDYKVVGMPTWEGFRETANSNYIGLTMPRFLLRVPYDPVDNPVKSFSYRERVEDGHENYLWGNTCFAFATRLTDSFARFGWCPYVVGPNHGGTVAGLPMHGLGNYEFKPPTEIMISDSMMMKFSEEGFIPLVWRKDKSDACFFYAHSVQMPLEFQDKSAQTNYRLGTQLPYLFLVSRLAHHIQVYQRNALGGNITREQMQNQLNRWVMQYVSANDQPDSGVIETRPFHAVKIDVDAVPGEPGWFSVRMALEPHIKYAGNFFQLSLVGKVPTANR